MAHRRVKNDPKVIAAYLGVDENEAEAWLQSLLPRIAVKTEVVEVAVRQHLSHLQVCTAKPRAPRQRLRQKPTGQERAQRLKSLFARQPVTKDDLKLIKGIGPVNEAQAQQKRRAHFRRKLQRGKKPMSWKPNAISNSMDALHVKIG